MFPDLQDNFEFSVVDQQVRFEKNSYKEENHMHRNGVRNPCNPLTMRINYNAPINGLPQDGGGGGSGNPGET